MKVFDFVGAVSPGRSMCKLDYEMKLTLDMGYWVPILADEAIPGDVWSISDEIVVRFQPMVAPPLHQIDCMIHYWAVPYRLLDPTWVATITRGEDGKTVGTVPSIVPTDPETQCVPGTLWDYIGYPVSPESPFVSSGATARYPAAWPVRAYNMIYNEYLRDQNWDDPVDLDDLTLKTKCWKKDYFTTSLPWPYRGDALAMPMSVAGSAHWAADVPASLGVTVFDQGADCQLIAQRSLGSQTMGINDGHTETLSNAQVKAKGNILATELNDNELVFDSISTFDFNDLRLLAQTQKWLERNARAGVRYGEFVYSHFGVNMGDDRLQRPEYIGGSISPVIVSEVLQTSASASGSTSQGNLAGHGIVVDQTKPIRYRVPEYCVIIGLMCVAPVPAYQSGLQKQWDRRTTFDYPFPEFANLGEQPVMTSELYSAGDAAVDDEIFGYQGRYNELRYKANRIAGEFRSTLDYWHLGRQFEDSPVNGPEFVHMDPTELKRIFAVHTGSHGLLATIGHRIRALRPIPMVASPGLVDH